MMRWMENTDRLALCLSKDKTLCGDLSFQLCVSGSSYRSLGRYWAGHLVWTRKMGCIVHGNCCPLLCFLCLWRGGLTLASAVPVQIMWNRAKGHFAGRCGWAGHRALTMCSYKGVNFWQKVWLAGNNNVSSCLLCICGAWKVEKNVVPPPAKILCAMSEWIVSSYAGLLGSLKLVFDFFFAKFWGRATNQLLGIFAPCYVFAYCKLLSLLIKIIVLWSCFSKPLAVSCGQKKPWKLQ